MTGGGKAGKGEEGKEDEYWKELETPSERR
jgi:hypothetical protein